MLLALPKIFIYQKIDFQKLIKNFSVYKLHQEYSAVNKSPSHIENIVTYRLILLTQVILSEQVISWLLFLSPALLRDDCLFLLLKIHRY